MTKPFDYEINMSGAKVEPVRNPLHSACLSDGEVDRAIAALKKDLDRVAKEMKAAIVEQAKSDLFDI